MDSRTYRVGAAVAASIFLLVVALFAASVVPIQSPGSPAAPPGEPVRGLAASGLNFDYILTIVMENRNLCDIYTHCGGTATYMTALADAYSISLQENYCNVNPSLPNYLCITGATDFGCAGYDGGPNSNPCTNSAWTSVNIIDRILDAGLTFKAYMEDMPSNCYGSDSGDYAVRHNPFVYYNDIVSNSTRCSQVVPAGTAASVLLADLASTSTASNYMWFTPNNCNNMHSCDIPTGDNYLSAIVPLILTSNVFLTQRAALLLTFDEGYGQPIYTVWAGPVVKTAYNSTAAYTHYSVLSTIESNWNLPPLTSNDQNAPNMNEFFGAPTPDFSLSANPRTVSFLAGQSATSTISLHSSGGFSGTVDLTATSAPAGISVSCVPSSISGTQTSTCTMGGSTPGSYTVTVTGTNGSLVHTTSIGVTVTAPPSPDFSISANPASVSFVTDQSATSTISLTSTGGFTGTVALTTASAPSGVAASCAPSSLSGTQTSTCTLTGSTPGSYTVTVTGTNGSLVHTASISVTVTAPPVPDFSITANPNTLSFGPGQSASSTISLQSTGGFNGAVGLTAASSPVGVTTSCVPASISGTETSACTMTGTTTGSYTVVVTGTSGTLSHTASIAVTVAAAGAPTARFTFNPPYPEVNISVTFDASASTDPDPSATLEARWEWEGDGVWDTPWSSTLTIQHVFANAGTYWVSLEVLDSRGLTGSMAQWVAVQSPGGGDQTPPQVAIISPSNDTVIASANVTVTGVAWDNVALSTIQLSTDNATWTDTAGTTSWSGSVLLQAGMNRIYARAIDTSGNVRTAVVTVIADHSDQGVSSTFPDPTVPILIGMSPVVALAAILAFRWNRTRTRGHGPKKEAEIVPRRETGDRWLLAGNGVLKR